MKRRVARLVGPRKIEIAEEDIPALADNQMLIKTRYVGLCHSDLPPWLGTGCTGLNNNGYHVLTRNVPYPFELGHEPNGVVEAVGKGIRNFKEGDVISGMSHQSFASHAICTEEIMVRADPDPKHCCLAEPLMCIANIAQIAKPEFGDRVAVVGCGFMGLLAIMALKNENLRELVAIDLQDQRLAMVKDYGATKTINPKKQDIEDVAFNITEGSMFDVVIELTGSLRGLDTAFSVIRLAGRADHRGRGKMLLSSVFGKEEQWNLQTSWNMMLRAPIIHVAHPRYCIDILETMRRGVDMYEKGILKMDELITHRIPFDDINQGFELLENSTPDYIKGVIAFD